MFTIPAGRSIDWTLSGIPGGIPSANWPIATTIAAPSGTADQTSIINNALSAAAANSVVMLSGGTYTISGSGIVIPSNKVLRGVGPQSLGGVAGTNQQPSFTVLNFTGSGNAAVAFGSLTDGQPNISNSVAITGGLTQGSTSITVASAANISVGKMLIISQLNDSSFVTIQGGEGSATWVDGGLGWNGTRAMGQTVLVTSVSGTTIGITPLYYAYNMTPLATPLAVQCQNGGIENLTLNLNSSNYGAQGNGAGTTRFYASLYCWMLNVETSYTGNDFLDAHFSYRCETRHCNFHDAYLHASGQTDSDVDITDKTSGFLFIDNIVYHGHVGVMCEWGASGNVFAYNWVCDSYDNGSPQACYPGFNPCHGAHPFMNLYEGNITTQIYSDDIWGSSSHQVFLRNWSTGCAWVPVTPPSGRGAIGTQMWTYQALTALNVELNQTSFIMIGNVLGSQQLLTGVTHYNDGSTHLGCTVMVVRPTSKSYDDESYCYSFGYNGLSDDGSNALTPSTASGTAPHTTSIIAGDYTFGQVAGAANLGTIWYNATSDTIPNSLIFGSTPSFFGTLAWPPINPASPPQTSTHTSTIIPAAYRFVNGAEAPGISGGGGGGGGGQNQQGTDTIAPHMAIVPTGRILRGAVANLK
jgi:hypothetical protein